MSKLEKKNFDTPDETRTPPKTKIDIVKVGDQTAMRITFQPGWKWSEHIKPVVGGDSCQVHHVGYQISGRMHVIASEGTKMEVGPGDVADIPPGHDAWVEGNEPAVMIDFSNASNYAKK